MHILPILAFSLMTTVSADTIPIEKFYAIGEEIQNVYGSMAKKEGKNLKINWYPEQMTPINASGIIENEVWTISVYGGLMLHPFMTLEAFRFILCHEMGHMIGGEPRFAIIDDYKSTNSGQPDYYASTVCMKLILKDKNNSFFSSKNVDPILNERCSRQFSDTPSQNLCRRIGNAGYEMSIFLANFFVSRPVGSPSFQTPSKVVVNQMESMHPEPQCRLDTILAGALCEKSPTGINSNEADLMNAACDVSPSSRPRCWFVNH